MTQFTLTDIVSDSFSCAKEEKSVMRFQELDWEKACVEIEVAGYRAIDVTPPGLSVQVWSVLAGETACHYLIDQGKAFKIIV